MLRHSRVTKSLILNQSQLELESIRTEEAAIEAGSLLCYININGLISTPVRKCKENKWALQRKQKSKIKCPVTCSLFSSLRQQPPVLGPLSTDVHKSFKVVLLLQPLAPPNTSLLA